MLNLILLFWIGQTLAAPTWYWWCWGVIVIFTIIKFGISMYRKGSQL